jgi:hypothetical protein
MKLPVDLRANNKEWLTQNNFREYIAGKPEEELMAYSVGVEVGVIALPFLYSLPFYNFGSNGKSTVSVRKITLRAAEHNGVTVTFASTILQYGR